MRGLNNHKTRSSRRGFSLVEMLVVIALSSLVLGLVISLMISLRDFDRLSSTKNTRNAQLLRLADTLRGDIRRGNDVSLSVEGPLVVMTASGEQLRYELGPDGCRRTVIKPGVARSSTDRFAIGEATKWNVERKAMGRKPLVAVTLEQQVHKNDPTAPKLLPFLVYAALGADAMQSAASTN